MRGVYIYKAMFCHEMAMSHKGRILVRNGCVTYMSSRVLVTYM